MKTTNKLMMYGNAEESLEIKPVRGVWVYDKETQTMVPQAEYRRKEPVAPVVIPDEMDPIVTNVDDSGRKFTSRSKYYQHLKDSGFAIKEKGMFPDSKPEWKPDVKEIRDTAERAYMDIKYDKVPFTEKEKATWKQEQERMRR